MTNNDLKRAYYITVQTEIVKGYCNRITEQTSANMWIGGDSSFSDITKFIDDCNKLTRIIRKAVKNGITIRIDFGCYTSMTDDSGYSKMWNSRSAYAWTNGADLQENGGVYLVDTEDKSGMSDFWLDLNKSLVENMREFDNSLYYCKEAKMYL